MMGTDNQKNPYVAGKSLKRKHRSLKINQKGEYRKFDANKKKAPRDARRHFKNPDYELRLGLSETISSTSQLTPYSVLQRYDIIHDECDWWDKNFVSDNNEYDEKKAGKGAFSVIQHCSTEIAKLVSSRKYAATPIKLNYTKAERKKMKHQRKMAKIKFLQEQVAMGLIEPPKNKESFKTLMKTINYDKDIDAVIAPTSKGQDIQSGINERALLHQATNIARKKTPAEKWAKKILKSKLDSLPGNQTFVSTYFIKDLLIPNERANSLRYKLDINCQKLFLNGVSITNPNGNTLVFVEGGPNAIYEFTKLMKRLDWNSIPKQDSKPIKPKIKDNYSSFIWNGYFSRAIFNKFDFFISKSQEETISFLEKKNLSGFSRFLQNKI